MPMPGATHLRVHSSFSFGAGASAVEELVERAAVIGAKRLALTDRNGLYGVVKFARLAREQGIHPVIGAEVNDPGDIRRTAVVLAADREGFAGLCRLVTSRRLDSDFRLAPALGNLGHGCRIMTDAKDVLEDLAAVVDRRFLYAEINPGSLRGGAAAARELSAAARRLGVPLVATGNVFFATPGGLRLHRLLRAIEGRRTLHDLKPEEIALPSQHLMSAGDMEHLFRDFPETLRESARLAEECRLELETGEWKFPRVQLEAGETSFSRLWSLSVRGLEERYRPVTPEAVERLCRELQVIQGGGFAPYFLVVHDILRQARRWGLRHVGRGSAANSLVSFCLGITAVDPLAHNLFFERFLNPCRASPPDIDIDFSWRERQRILDYVSETYGRDRVAMIGTHVTFGPRAAVREVARALGLGPREIGQVTRRIPHWAAGPLGDLRERVPECRDLPLDQQPWRGIMAAAERIIGFPRHLSCHPGGVIIAPEPLTRWCPLERTASGTVVTQYDMFGVEDMRLVKIDLLSQRSLGVLEDVLSDVRRVTGAVPDVSLERVTSDAATRELISRGKTMGCFYVESPGMRGLLRKLETSTFPDLTAASSVIRPGVAESGMMRAYVERHRNPETVRYPHPLLEEILGETHGVMIYQEDVMRVAHLVGGLSLAEADLLRRSMSGKLRSREAMASLKKRFLDAAGQRGLDPGLAGELWRQMESFAGYAFCKAHSASYAVLSFQLAYLKAHHPAVFMAAVLSNGGGYYRPAAYIQECRRLGLEVLPPDVNLSRAGYTAEGNGVRVGLAAVKSLSGRGLAAILEARLRNGRFPSPEELARRTGLSKRELEALTLCGAMDNLGLSRPELFWRLALLGRTGGKRSQGDPLLAPAGRLPLPPLTDHDHATRCAAELDVLGFTTAVHPLELFTRNLPTGVVSASEMATMAGRQVTMTGWPIAGKRVVTRRGEVMKFLSLEDLTGTFEAVLFPPVYRRLAATIACGGPLVLTGTVEGEHGVFSLTVKGARILERGSTSPVDIGLSRFL